MSKFGILLTELLILPSFVSCQAIQSTKNNAGQTQNGGESPTVTAYRTFDTPLPSKTPTRHLFPSPTSVPTHFYGLTTAGPYLRLYPAYSSDPNPQVLFDLDGSGKEEIQLPESDYGSLSPDAHRFARLAFGPDSTVVLEVIDIWNGTTLRIVNLIPMDYSERQERMIEEYKAEIRSRPDSYEFYYLEYLNLESAVYGLMDGLRNLAWSPDGRYLAFPAMIDGDSTDVYLLDIDTGILQRKDDELLNVFSITWSPDGQWILFSNVLPRSGDPIITTTYWSVRADSSRTVRLAEACNLSWISDEEFLSVPCAHGCGGNGWSVLYLSNIRTGASGEVWRGIFYDYAVDKENGTALIVSEEPCAPDDCISGHPGYYLGPLFGKKIRVADVRAGSDAYSISIIFRGGAQHRFLINTFDALSGVIAGGKVDLLLTGDISGVQISPDYRWIAVLGDSGITLFDERDETVYSWKAKRVISASWKTNSQGVYFQTDGEIYYLQVAPPAAQFLLDCSTEQCGEGTWISLLPSIHLDSLPDLRAQPPAINHPTQGPSLWSQTSFQDLLKPGNNEYSLAIPPYSSWRWDFSWCAADETRLAEILKPFGIEFFIGGEKIGEDAFRIYDSAKGGQSCRTWATLLSGWQPGDATELEIRYTLRETVDDGVRVYPPGEYRQIIHVTVT